MKVVVSIVIPVEKDYLYTEKLYELCNVHPKPQRVKLKRTFRMLFFCSYIPPFQDSNPIRLPLRDGFKEPRHDGMELHGTDAGDAFRLGQGFRPD